MSFSETYERDMRSARLRGLTPFLVHFRFKIQSLTISCSNQVVVTLERKTQTVDTPLLSVITPTTTVSESLSLLLVLARRGGIDSDLSDECIVRDGVPLGGFETIMARMKVREGGKNGMVVDSTTVNLCEFVCSRKSVCNREIELQLGGKVKVQVEAIVLKEGEDGAHLESLSESSDVEAEDFEDWVGTEKEKETEEEDETKHGEEEWTRSEVGNVDEDLDKDVLAGSTEVKARETVVAADEEEETPLWLQDNLSADLNEFDPEGSGDEERPYDEHVHSRGALFGVRMTRTNALGEYTTVCRDGEVWREVPVISRVETPERLRVWSIQGPDEMEDDEEEEGEEGEVRKKPSPMVLSSDKPGPKAKVGKLSPLQKVCVYMEGVSRVVHMGVPVSLEKGSVKQVAGILANEVGFIDEPELSEIESESDEEERKNETRVLKESDDDDGGDDEDNVDEEEEGEDDYEFEKRDVEEPSTNDFTENRLYRLNSGRDEDCVVAELRRQVDSLIEYIKHMQDVMRETENEKTELRNRLREVEEVDTALLRELQLERRLHNASQKENERLLGVITSLKHELDKSTMAAKKKKKGLFGFGSSKSTNKENAHEN